MKIQHRADLRWHQFEITQATAEEISEFKAWCREMIKTDCSWEPVTVYPDPARGFLHKTVFRTIGADNVMLIKLAWMEGKRA